MFVKKEREFFFFWIETKREKSKSSSCYGIHGWSDAKRHERTREIKRREGRDLLKVVVQRRKRCNPSSLISLLFDSNHAQQRKGEGCC